METWMIETQEKLLTISTPERICFLLLAALLFAVADLKEKSGLGSYTVMRMLGLAVGFLGVAASLAYWGQR
jgi:hypothetical protein